MPGNFDLEKYLKNSRKVEVSDIDFSEVSRYPLSGGEARCLTYMMDIESHTIVYLRGILSTCAIEDPETTPPDLQKPESLQNGIYAFRQSF